jgi:NAD+ kinase
MRMKTLGVIANCAKTQAPDALRRLRRAADEHGARLLADGPTGALLGPGCEAPFPALLDRIEALIVLGGDGTMLRAVRELDGRDTPVIGVNLGGLGFMTSVAETDLERAVQCLVTGEFATSLRTVAEATARRGDACTGRYRALNDIVVLSTNSRVVTLRTAVDGEDVSDSVCDGLIVSTPTGSTGHSLSAGGPILLPSAGAFVISLICPHTLSTRPLVVPDDRTIRVGVVASTGAVSLTADGQVGQTLREGDQVDVRRSERSVRLVHLPGYRYFAVLRQKLHWRGSNV